ncbi:MAG: DUF998 domain-containing protein [Thermoleophilia bacterium]|nr:DUF998 domain-containing protein [Thermoleophilia bacterium]
MRIGWLAAAGVAAGVVFTAGWLVAGLVSRTADVGRGTLSDLGAATADRPWIWNSARTVAGVLVVAVSLGVYRRARGLPGAAAGVVLLGLFGAALAAAFVARRDCRTTEPACGTDGEYSWQHVAHEVASPFGSFGLMIALVVLTRAFAHDPRLAGLARYSRATVGAFLVLLVAYLLLEERPGAGISQRLSSLVVFVWLAAVAYRLDRLAPRAVSS